METIRKHICEYNVIAEEQLWEGSSYVRVRVRKIGHSDKIAVDLFELSPEGTEVDRVKLNHIAIEAARAHGMVASHDFCVVLDYLTARKSTRLDGSITYTNIRQKSYAFRGV